MSNSYCPLPWIGVSTRSTGDLRVCCQSDSSKPKGSILKDDGQNFNISTDGLKTFRNSKILKEVRKTILLGNSPDMCSRCVKEEAAGFNSNRIYMNENWNTEFSFNDAIANTSDDGSIDENIVPIKYADLRLGNLCNLKCRMCGPTDSSSWYDDYLKISNSNVITDNSGNMIKIITNSDKKAKLEIDIYNWHENPEFWKNLENHISELKHIFIIGGEPLLIDNHYTFLEKCISSGYADKIYIEIMSNITNIPNKAWKLWEHFKLIQISPSIDGVGELNNYIRYPSKWTQIEKNLSKLVTTKGNFRIVISPTILSLNLLHLPELMMWKFTNFPNTKLNSHLLHWPMHYNIKIFPPSSKIFITNYFEECKLNYKDRIMDTEKGKINYQFFCKELDKATSFMNAEDLSAHIPEFFRINNELDTIRDQRLEIISPITYKLLKGI